MSHETITYKNYLKIFNQIIMKEYKIKVLKEISRSLHPLGAYCQKNQKVTSVVEDAEKLECLHTGNRNVK